MQRVLAGKVVAPASTGSGADRELVERAARGEAGAFGQLYQRHVDHVYGYLRFRVHDEAVAEDLTHDVFVSAFKAIEGLKDPSRFEAWLMRIAHNRVLNHWRERSARPATAEPAALDEAGGATEAGGVAEAGGGIARAEVRLDAHNVLEAASALTDLQHQVIALRFVAGLSLAETAAVMGRSVGAVKNLQHHALAGLRSNLSEREGSK